MDMVVSLMAFPGVGNVFGYELVLVAKSVNGSPGLDQRPWPVQKEVRGGKPDRAKEQLRPSFRNDDSVLRQRVEQVVQARRALGLEGLRAGFRPSSWVVEPDRLKDAAAGFLNTTGYSFGASLDFADGAGCVLHCPGSADFLFRTRSGGAFAQEPLGRSPRTCPALG